MISAVRRISYWNVLILIVVLNFVLFCGAQENNVCPTFKDYYTIKNNSNCWYDFTAEFDTRTIVKMHGFDFSEYKIQTKDGHILGLFKIPSRIRSDPTKRYFPVFLQHGLLSTASNFVAVGKDSLAFTLADAGYDVWLGNYRGNEYSEGHVKYTTRDNEFWDHSMDDIVKYDFPAIFEKILAETPSGGQIIYIGHSLGTSLALMYNAKYHKEAKHIFKLVILLCPAYTISNMRSPYRLAAPFGQMILNTALNMDLMRLFSQAEPTRGMMRRICLESPNLMERCLRAWNLFYGLDATIGPENVPIFFHQLPGGTSLKVGKHSADLVLGNFRHYDHGYAENIKRYGTAKPPIYDIKKIETPIYIVYSTADWATTEQDALNLYNKLPKVARHGIRKISEKNFNHIDFIFTRAAKKLVYDDLLNVINNVIPESSTKINVPI
ncbi:lipase member K-like [Harmonia axyridis]|uniref:lipase member K-like n=1 Tax=Harmonia axyridis TaxID=115357 RepID=UPI001E27802C|nr:lipase member K-like [Harmonia axyridis]